MATPWTPNDDASLTRLWTDEATVEVIAADLERTVGAVNRRRNKLGLPSRTRGRKLEGNLVQVYARISEELATQLPGAGTGKRPQWFRAAIEEKLERDQ